MAAKSGYRDLKLMARLLVGFLHRNSGIRYRFQTML